MENLNPTSAAGFKTSNNSVKKSRQASYRGFISIDQEMGREIAMSFFNPSKKTLCSKKGFLFIKD